jgi:aldose 1-epimerase
MKLIDPKNFEKEVNSKKLELFTLKNANDITCQISNYGGRLVSLWVPDRNGNFEDVVLGYSDIEDYLSSKEKYFGATIGRYGNRIARGEFSLDGKQYILACNSGLVHLHGGNAGFDSVVWTAQQIDEQTLELSYISRHLEEGYPGNLTINVMYQLNNENELVIEYLATTDQSTIINLTHHSFFNLKGAGNGNINDHLLQVNATHYTPIDQNLIPNGELELVENTPMDFQELCSIGERLEENSQQLKYASGYDHNYALKQNPDGLNFAARVIEPVSGRVLEALTNEPGLQFYGGNFLDGTITGKNDKIYEYRSAFCLETQHYPDSPNNAHFPSCRLDPGEEYYSVCVYKFSTLDD